MIEIEKKYFLREITIKVNKRILTYDYALHRVIYTYNGINKEEFKMDYNKWGKIIKKYKLNNDYVFCKYEEIINDNRIRKTVLQIKK